MSDLPLLTAFSRNFNQPDLALMHISGFTCYSPAAHQYIPSSLLLTFKDRKWYLPPTQYLQSLDKKFCFSNNASQAIKLPLSTPAGCSEEQGTLTREQWIVHGLHGFRVFSLRDISQILAYMTRLRFQQNDCNQKINWIALTTTTTEKKRLALQTGLSCGLFIKVIRSV